MKTLIVSLAALAAVSGVALAAGGDGRDNSDTYFGKHKVESQAVESNAFVIRKHSKKPLTAFERMNLDAGGDRGGNARDSEAPSKM